jgi:nicotinamidase-related amidase
LVDTRTLDRQHTALLIMDYQNAVVFGVAEKHPDLLERTAAVLAAARAANLRII